MSASVAGSSMNETDEAMAVACGWITTADDGQRAGAMSLAVLAMRNTAPPGQAVHDIKADVTMSFVSWVDPGSASAIPV
jgi:hypothetical protein